MSLEDWQIALRRDYGQAQKFKMKKIGSEPVFSEFIIENPETRRHYRVAIRGERPGENYCSCPDFSVNTLGTCKHIEFALAKLRKRPGAAAALRKGCRTPYSSVHLSYGPKREVIFKAGVDCPPGLISLAGGYFDAKGALRAEAFFSFDDFLKKASKFRHELRCYEDAIQYIAQVRDQRNLRQAIEKSFPHGPRGLGAKDLLKIPLYPYQLEGAYFAACAGRAVIADEMGLGKTIQALAACEMLAGTMGISRVLIVCPASLKHQWKDEIEKFSGRGAVVIEGDGPARARLYSEDSFYKLVNYDVIESDIELIRQWFPDLIILDEAQRIKNWKTKTAQAVKRLESPYAFVLTGTPLENRLEELHSIVEFVDRFHLGPRFRFLHEHQVTDQAGMVVGYKNLAKICQTLSPVLIRRTKHEVLKELPERLEKKFFVEMTKEQMDYHDENKETVARIVAKWRKYHFLSETDQRVMLTALQNMRMSCNSTYLLDKTTDFGHKADELMALLEDIFNDPEAKAVVFSQWLGTHELIIRRLNGNKREYAFLHGAVPSPKRKGLIKRFREDPECRLFLSTEAGGVGMNLQNASAIINMDLPWNPAVLEQRIGRVHRLGQRRPVRVVNFIASGTIEHGMLSLLSFKKSLFAGVMDGGQDEVFLGGSRLKNFMDSVDKATSSIPATAAAEAVPGPGPGAGAGEGVVPEKLRAGPAAQTEQVWAELANAGLAFIDKLGQALELKPEAGLPGKTQPGSGRTVIERDQAGRSYLKLPLPDPGALKKIADLIYQFAGK